MTVDAVRDRSKRVTRRHVDTWKTLKVGDRLTLIEKGMGLKLGEKQVVLAEVEIVSVRIEPILAVTEHEIHLEGFDHNDWGDLAWSAWWAKNHGYPVPTWGRGKSYQKWQHEARAFLEQHDVQCRRIEWRYLDDPDPSHQIAAA